MEHPSSGILTVRVGRATRRALANLPFAMQTALATSRGRWLARIEWVRIE